MDMSKGRRRYVAFMATFILIWTLSGCGTITGTTSRKAVSGIPDPVQEEAQGGTSFELDGYNVQIKYMYSYDINALVVGAHKYSDSDMAGKLAPKDLALAWGKVAEYNDRIDFHWSQSNRWYYWKANSYSEIDVVGGTDGVSQHSANNHLIGADDTVKADIDKIDAGDHIRLKGYLVNVYASKPDGTNFWWNSSTSRTDTGDGSCEVIYVTNVEWLD